jgi:hypothetical protein
MINHASGTEVSLRPGIGLRFRLGIRIVEDGPLDFHWMSIASRQKRSKAGGGLTVPGCASA